MRRLRVLVDGRLAGTRPTGIQRYVVGLTHAMAGDPDVEVTVLVPPAGLRAPAWDDAPEALQLITCRRSPSSPLAIVDLPRHSRAAGVDVVLHPHVTLAISGHGRPSIVTVHDTKHLEVDGDDGRSSLSRARRGALTVAFRLSTRRSAAVIAVSRRTAADIARHRGDGHPDGPAGRRDLPPVHVVHEGVAGALTGATQADIARLRVDLDLQRPWVLCVGESRPHKNHLRLIEAFTTSRSAGTHDLLLVGRRHDAHDEVMSAIRATRGLVRWVEDLDDAGLAAAYAGASLFALPSLHEGFGLPLVEAMAAGTPIVTSSGGACEEVAADAALTVDPRDVDELRAAIDRVVHDDELAADLVTRGRHRATTFTWERAARETIAILRQAAD